MANISIRKLDDVIHAQLRLRAAEHGISTEEEVRRILTQAVRPPERISEVFKKHFGKHNSADGVPLPKRTPHNPLDFES